MTIHRTALWTSCSLLALALALPGFATADEKKPAVETKSVAKEKTGAPVARDPKAAVARVNGVPLTGAELDRRVQMLLTQGNVPKPASPEIMKKAETIVVNQFIGDELLYQAGLKTAPKDLDKQVEEQVAKGKKSFPSTADYEKALKQTGMTEKEIADMVRRGLVIKNLVNTEVASKVTVSDAEISKFYEENKDKLFKTDESVRVSHILIGVDAKADVAQKRKAREKAEGILKRIRGGEDFAALAKKESTCPSAPLGGDLGFFTKGQMVQEFEKAAFELKPGEVSNVVETKYGFHIIKLQDRKSAGITPLNEEKKKIETYLKAQKVRNGVEGYLMNLQKTAKVETLIN